ncbi:MAG: fluoride efflux transporter CrcB [Ruminococcus sp.]|nr:fluoride efflux transporter CrcB [Ruminococcus sp.]
MNYLYVALGGALGTTLRYAISQIPYKSTFPILTLITNLLGAFLIGIVTGLAVKKNLSENTILFLKTGLCGGFTTFSTFSLEAFTLIKNQHITMGIIYIVLSVALCLIGVFSGVFLTEKYIN